MRSGTFKKSPIATDMEATVHAQYQKLLKHLNLTEDELENEYA